MSGANLTISDGLCVIRGMTCLGLSAVTSLILNGEYWQWGIIACTGVGTCQNSFFLSIILKTLNCSENGAIGSVVVLSEHYYIFLPGVVCIFCIWLNLYGVAFVSDKPAVALINSVSNQIGQHSLDTKTRSLINTTQSWPQSQYPNMMYHSFSNFRL